MKFIISIDKNSEVPIYRQIIEQITTMTKNGILKAGDRLPPERELADTINIARGTIKKAYEELQRNRVVDVIQGRGTFISMGQDVFEEGRKEKAIVLVDELIADLESMKFTHREIDTLVRIRIMEREMGLNKVKIAAVDCNPEALSIFKKQLSYISNIDINKFLFEEIHKCNDIEEVFEGYDILITTSTHYQEMCELVPGLREKVVQAAVSPSQQTIIDFAKIPDNSSVGIICSSKQFLRIIKIRLEFFSIDLKSVEHVFDYENIDFCGFLNNKDILIIPPDFTNEGSKRGLMSAIEKFEREGGKVIKFEYQIERGSLIYIEEQISNILKKK